MRELTVDQVEHSALYLARRLMEWDEPIPDFSTRFPGKLESCLKTPWQTFDGRALYPSLEDKAAVLFYLMIKNHPFQNGNKRLAVTSLMTFLYMNDLWLGIPSDVLYQFAIWVAESPAEAKDGTILAVKDMIKKYLMTPEEADEFLKAHSR
ncbi:MAG TPA: type II toxin-antitoxin system death-on-curing family toxin [bacterium]|nr:type II toxin-antitoxin system death-on-curing family toxin [bacterium]